MESPPGLVFRPFEPRRWLRNGHLQTVFGNFLPRRDALPPAEARLVAVSPASESQMASQVLCHCHWQPADVRADRLTVILLHGLEGSSNSQYVVGNANKMWVAGMNIIRTNMRNCGGTESWSPTLYHSGLSGDIRAVLLALVAEYDLQKVGVAGYSMGGNLVLKLAGEYGHRPPAWLVAVAAVSPAADLAASADELHRPANRIYEQHFLRNLIKRFHRKAALYPESYKTDGVGKMGSVREFDDRITAPYSGFKSADDYYYRASAARVLDQISLPALVLHAIDDPFIRLTPETRARIVESPAIQLVETRHGGHCAFLAASSAIGSGSKISSNLAPDRHWAEATVVRYIASQAQSFTRTHSREREMHGS